MKKQPKSDLTMKEAMEAENAERSYNHKAKGLRVNRAV